MIRPRSTAAAFEQLLLHTLSAPDGRAARRRLRQGLQTLLGGAPIGLRATPPPAKIRAFPLRLGDETMGWITLSGTSAAAQRRARGWAGRLALLLAADERLRELAGRDALTGLGNRRRGDETLPAAWARARRSRRPLTVALLDLTGLKKVNDTRGHAAGDEKLRALADRLRRGLRASDTVIRWGGDEFLALLPGAEPAAARRVLQRIAADPAAPRFVFGLAAAQHCSSPARALCRADQALRRARARAGEEMGLSHRGLLRIMRPHADKITPHGGARKTMPTPGNRVPGGNSP